MFAKRSMCGLALLGCLEAVDGPVATYKFTVRIVILGQHLVAVAQVANTQTEHMSHRTSINL